MMWEPWFLEYELEIFIDIVQWSSVAEDLTEVVDVVYKVEVKVEHQRPDWEDKVSEKAWNGYAVSEVRSCIVRILQIIDYAGRFNVVLVWYVRVLS